MDGPIDLMERVRAADPAPLSSVEGWSRTPEGRAVAERALRRAQEDRPPRRPGSGRLMLIAAVVGLVALGTVAVLANQRTANSLAVGCFAAADLRADRAVVALGDFPTPEDACRSNWRSAFHEEPPARLATCVMSDGGHGVFPIGPDDDPSAICAALGLEPNE
jgi:hypothetical protein